MARARFGRWLRALFVVPVLVFGLSATSRLEVRCALTGLLMPDCCPEVEAPPTRSPEHASMSERDCCERTVVATDKLPAGGPEPGAKRAPPAVGRLVPSLLAEALPPPGARDARTNPGATHASPPPYLLTHAFLI